MIQVIISKEFIEVLISAEIKTQEYIFAFFNKLAPYQFTTDLNAEVLYQLQANFPFLRKLTTSVANYRFLPFELSIENIESKLLVDINHHTKFILINIHNEECDQLRRNKGIFFSNVATFEISFKTFFLTPPKTWNINELWIGIDSQKKSKFRKWEDIVERITDSCFYFISDRYCLDINNTNLLYNNLVKLLVDILTKLPEKIIPTFYINTIVTEPKKINALSPTEFLDGLVKEQTNRQFNLKVFDITLSKKKHVRLDDHSRFIATHYYFLQSDHSFNYFDANGNLFDKKCRILDNLIFTDEYGYFFMDEFYKKFNQILNKSGIPQI